MEAALNSSLGRTVLGQTSLRIGRAPDNALVITDPQSSAHHAEIAPGMGANSYQITDLGSTNGTFVNEQRLAPNAPRPLNANDVVRIGATQFTYEVTGGYASSPGYEPTVMAAPPSFTPPPQPAYQPPAAAMPPAYQPPIATPPAQPAYTPPPAYQPPQPAYAPLPAQPAYAPPQAAYTPPQAPVYPQPQPGYGVPGGFNQPGYPPKKSHTGLWIAIVVIVLVVIVGGGTGVYFAVRSTPQKTLNNYCDGLKTDNPQEIYNQLDSASQAKTSVNDIGKVLALVNNPLTGGIKDCTVNSVTENGSTAVGNLTLTPGKGKASSGNINLVNENGTWKVDIVNNSNSGLPSQ